MKKITNSEEIISQLVDLLMQFDLELNHYQTDVYLYVTENEDGTITGNLDTFVNVGGNSWLNDDHFTIYRDKEHFDDFLDYWQSIEEIAAELEISAEDLKTEARLQIYGTDPYFSNDDIIFSVIREYIMEYNVDYYNMLFAAFKDHLNDCKNDGTYEANAICILQEFNDDCTLIGYDYQIDL